MTRNTERTRRITLSVALPHESKRQAPPRSARSTVQDPWEAVVREELRRFRRRTADGRRLADVASRSAQRYDDAHDAELQPPSDGHG